MADANGQRGAAWRWIWPAALGMLVAAGTVYGLTDARDAAPVIAASGLVYLAAGASGHRAAAWIAFAATFLLITLDKFAGLDALPWLFALAAVLLAAGIAWRRVRPWWSFPLQAVAMLILGAITFVALQLSPMAGCLFVAAALLGHAIWDIHHHRVDRVVDRALARFCAVLDILVAVFVAILALSR
ncbi:hypothetical protein [Leucobacter tenebrionis]|uniref:hypothetical protein n=1 Tax=Leucobacter tenebrionis TaxID=2873270 RepID=UPI001CA66A4F|nr:hypothetical protein [Leucobacter tenebrionis]QZY52140.1 hypothetical protein KVY00_01295 [Leucobacter tenebrionis]